jgi:hypothetical protein
MFIYVLIAFELALVYLVFWYLYLRTPKIKRKIKGAQWGRYQDSPYTTDGGGYYPTINGNTDREACGTPVEPIHSFVPYKSEFVLNERTNRYVRDERRQVKSLIAKLASSLDSTLGQLNVRD